MKGLYIHIPFCLTKCPYCDFYSEKYSKALAEQYKQAVIRNLKNYPESFDTVYFGGGTPILLYREIAEILGAISFSENAEISLEANPCVSDRQRLTLLRESGVNRISFGVQSMNEKELRFLGRRHTARQAENALKSAYEAGFENISADIMLGLQGQSEEDISYTIKALSELPVTHISAYLLKIEENTPFYREQPPLPDGDRMAELYLHACEELEKHGFIQYEISNFAKKGYECRHNLKYWRCEEYLGVGSAAHSYYEGRRFSVPRDLNRFIADERQTTEITDENAGGFEEYEMLRLRLAEGLSFADCERLGVSKETVLERCDKVPRELINIGETGISLTRAGFLVSNAVIGKISGY